MLEAKIPHIISFGCRLNTYESEVMRQHAKAAGLDNIVIVNTCAVTGEAERQARQAIRKARRERPEARIVVTGCAAQINPEQFLAMPEVDHVIGNDGKMEEGVWRKVMNTPSPAKTKDLLAQVQVFASSPSRGEENKKSSNIGAVPVKGFEGKSRAFVQVQNGCDHRCTFCVIPFGRGPSRSVPVEAIIEQVRTLADNGYGEMTLTGVDIASYGMDLPDRPTPGSMIRRVLEVVPGLTRLRLSSLDPAAIDEDLWEIIADEPRLMPHLHLSLQAGDAMVLKRMKRRHTPEDIVALCERARRLRPDLVFGADVIAGFPTETEAMFVNTMQLIETCDIAYLHVFPYSARKGTPAARMPQVKGDLRRERAARLRELGANNLKKHLDSLVGKRLDVLVEKPELGRTPSFAEARLLTPEEVGAVVTVDVVGRDGLQVVAQAMKL